jgi:hypothetical protein
LGKAVHEEHHALGSLRASLCKQGACSSHQDNKKLSAAPSHTYVENTKALLELKPFVLAALVDQRMHIVGMHDQMPSATGVQ